MSNAAAARWQKKFRYGRRSRGRPDDLYNRNDSGTIEQSLRRMCETARSMYDDVLDSAEDWLMAYSKQQLFVDISVIVFTGCFKLCADVMT